MRNTILVLVFGLIISATVSSPIIVDALTHGKTMVVVKNDKGYLNLVELTPAVRDLPIGSIISFHPQDNYYCGYSESFEEKGEIIEIRK